MKKKISYVLLASAIAVCVFSGCGKRGTDQSAVDDNREDTAQTEDLAIDSTGTDYVMDTESDTSQLQLGNAVEIPEGFDGELAETDAHERLEQVIAAYCNVAEEEYENIRYYYNYVDLNGDSEDEILALVLGQEVEGIEGNMLLWLDADSADTSADAVKQSFKQVGAPIYISNHMTDGYRDLIIPEDANIVAGTEGSGMDTVGGDDLEEAVTEEANASGSNAAGTDEGAARAGADASRMRSDDPGTGTSAGQEGIQNKEAAANDGSDEYGIDLISLDQQYRLLVWTGERYQRIEEGTALFSLEGYEGVAILSNNIESDLANDNYHFLGEAMK